ncbi:hypothetical protein F4779DRAFT_584332 [Xylariaceae sp. FL0662B]|nr:hypothetical protein F4779DRAFT_584332 [Xylariaceae sp. FL0662B]
MLTTSTFLTLLTLGLATASPILHAPRASKSLAFHLQLSLADPSKDLDPPIAGQFLSVLRVGAGQNAAIVGPQLPEYTYTPFYVNGTEAAATAVLNDLGLPYPFGIQVVSRETSDPQYPGEHSVGINVGAGTAGLNVGTEAAPALTGPSKGTYAVCTRFVGAVRADEPLVRFVYEGESTPGDCVEVAFVPICAQLNELPEGSQWTHDYVQEVYCVESLS